MSGHERGVASTPVATPATQCTLHPHPPSTPAVRTFDQRTVLDMFSGRITAVSLSGYLFFGRWVWEQACQLSHLLPSLGLRMEAGFGASCCQSTLPLSDRPCSSVNVVERVVQIANSTLESQPQHEQGAGEAPAEAGPARNPPVVTGLRGPPHVVRWRQV